MSDRQQASLAMIELSREHAARRRVVCAAILYDDAMTVGPRHGDEVMRHQKTDSRPIGRGVQGFIDQWGVFMDRKEAWKVAVAAEQIIYRSGGDGQELYSENLY